MTEQPSSRQLEARIDSLFPRPVYLVMNPDAAAIRDRVLGALDNYPELAADSTPSAWYCSVATTFGERAQVLTDEPLTALFPFISANVATFAKQLGWRSDGFTPAIFESWLNVYRRGTFQEVHQHPMSHLSGVYYVDAPPDSGSLFFQSPEPSMYRPDYEPTSRHGEGSMVYPPQTGLLVLFPSELRHGVQPNMSDHDRVSLAFNVRQRPT